MRTQTKLSSFISRPTNALFSHRRFLFASFPSSLRHTPSLSAEAWYPRWASTSASPTHVTPPRPEDAKFVALQTDRLPALPGESFLEVETPALVLDLAVFTRNLQRCSELLRPFPNVSLRPHVKSHKCVEVAAMQLEVGGAIGVCCQKVSEAEAMVAGGILDVLVSNEVVSPKKLRRLVRLSLVPGARISLCVDSEHGVRALSQAINDVRAEVCETKVARTDMGENPRKGRRIASACERAQGVIGVLVEVNMGQNRCGVDSVSDAVGLARMICAAPEAVTQGMDSPLLPSFVFLGVQCYHGMAQHIEDEAERRQCVENYTRAKVVPLIAALQQAQGVLLPRDWHRPSNPTRSSTNDKGPGMVVTGGGTGTFLFEASGGVYTEVQPGSYPFMDVAYQAVRGVGEGVVEIEGGKAGQEKREHGCGFQASLFVLTEVMSAKPNANPPRVVLDAGTKASSVDCGQPAIWCKASEWATMDPSSISRLTNTFTDIQATDEHTQMNSNRSALSLVVGARVLMVPGHVDPTINMHQWLLPMQDRYVVAVWRIARGVGQ